MGSPLALLSLFKLFLIAIAIYGSGLRDVLRLIQPGAPQGSDMQRDMKCDVTCCTVTSASLLAILCLASGRSEDTRFTGKSMEQHQLLIQRREGRFTPLALSAATTSREKPGTVRRPSWSAH